MLPFMLSRASVLLAFAGMFIAAFLSLAHYYSASIPCGLSQGCDRVATHPSAFWLGQPVAYWGLLGYGVLALLGSIRLLKGLRETRTVGMAALLFSGAGAIASFYLQWVALVEIKAFCPWCMASAVTMALLFLVHAAMTNAESGPLKTDMDMVLIGGSALAVVLGLVLGANQLQKKADAPAVTGQVELPTSREEILAALVPEDSLKMGPDSAPIKIVEFSDQMCAACRRMHDELKEIVRVSEGKVQWVYRHWPMPMRGHEMSRPAAFLVEYAAEKGKGWEYVEALKEVPISEMLSIASLFEPLEKVGLDRADAEKRIANVDSGDDPITARVYRDFQMAMGPLKLEQTPTFIVIAPDMEPQLTTMSKLKPLLNEPPYRKVLGREIK